MGGGVFHSGVGKQQAIAEPLKKNVEKSFLTNLYTWSTSLMSSPPVLGLASLYIRVVVNIDTKDMNTLKTWIHPNQ